MLINKKLLLSLSAGFLLFSSSRAAVLTGVDPTIINVGTGPDLSYLVIDESTLYSTPLEFVYHYTYDSNNLISGIQMLQTITNSLASGLSIGITNDGTIGDGSDFFTSITYKGNSTVPMSDTNGGTYFSLYVAGGLNEDGGGTNGYSVQPANQWTYSDVGMDDRFITPGSWDGWTLSGWGTNTTVGGAPSVSIEAVPEPKPLPLVFLSIVTLGAILRWKRFQRA